MSAATQKPTHRLHDMEVEEISLVTVPANKKKFLVMKDADGEHSLELEPVEGGTGFRLVDKGEGPPEQDGEIEVKLTKAARDALLEVATEELEKLTAITKALDSAEIVDVQDENAEESVDALQEQLGELSTSVGDLAKKVGPMTCKACGFKGVPAKGGACPKCGKAMKADAPPPAEGMKKLLEKSETEEGRAEIAKAMEAHAKILQEKLDAMKLIMDDIHANAATMDAKDLRTKLNQLDSLGWKIGDSAEVVNIGKSDVNTGTAPAAKKVDDPPPTENLKKLIEKVETEEGRTEIGKAMEIHQKIMQEKLDAMKLLMDDIHANAATMDPKDLREKLRRLDSLGWKIGDSVEVVNIGKTDEETALLVQAAEIRGMNKALEHVSKLLPRGISQDDRPDINAGAGALPAGSGMPAETYAESMSSVPGMAEIAKQLADLKKQLAKLEAGKGGVSKSVGAPQSSQPDGGGAAPAKPRVTWPIDMNSESR